MAQNLWICVKSSCRQTICGQTVAAIHLFQREKPWTVPLRAHLSPGSLCCPHNECQVCALSWHQRTCRSLRASLPQSWFYLHLIETPLQTWRLEIREWKEKKNPPAIFSIYFMCCYVMLYAVQSASHIYTQTVHLTNSESVRCLESRQKKHANHQVVKSDKLH